MVVRKRTIGLLLAVACMAGTSGCDSGSSGGGGSMSQAGEQLEAEEVAEQQAATQAAEQQAAQQAAANAPQQPAEPARTAVGSRAPMEGGYFAAIGSARRHVLNVVDTLAWTQGVRNFKAEQGRKPKDHAEFMSRVVEYYELQLPQLEEGQEYLYDPNGETDGDFGQLYVVDKTTPPEPAPQQ
jgi:hypothetical protein